MASAPNHTALTGRTILVVEDDFFQAEDMICALREAGARALGPFPSAGAAIEALNEGAEVDAAVLDISLRGRMVYPLADMLGHRGIPFLFATGYDRDVLPDAFHMIEVWEKPFKIDRLLAALAGLCAPLRLDTA